MDISSYQQDSNLYEWGIMIHFQTKLKTFVLRVPYIESDNEKSVQAEINIEELSNTVKL